MNNHDTGIMKFLTILLKIGQVFIGQNLQLEMYYQNQQTMRF